MFMAYIRLQIFEAIRVATMIVRIIGAVNYTHATDGTTTFNESLLIAEQVRLVCLGTTCVDVLIAVIDPAQHWLLSLSSHPRQAHDLP